MEEGESIPMFKHIDKVKFDYYKPEVKDKEVLKLNSSDSSIDKHYNTILRGFDEMGAAGKTEELKQKLGKYVKKLDLYNL